MSRRFEKAAAEYMDEFRRDLAELVACRSVRDTGHAAPGEPFGPGVKKAFGVFLGIAGRFGLQCRDLDGYACDAQVEGIADEEEYVGILGHLDVVEAGNPDLWTSDPYHLTERNGVWYGRGVNDDKGPLLACLYAVRILKDMGIKFKRNLRIIAGGAEETTWECMEHYFRMNSQPVMGFSPDGNFPLVNGEKGILKCALTFPPHGEGDEIAQIRCSSLVNYVCDNIVVTMIEGGEEQEYRFEGKRALSRNPQKGVNALWKLAEWMRESGLPSPAGRFAAFMQECMTDDYYGRKSGLYAEDAHMGYTSVCPTGVEWNEKGIVLYLDLRYPKSIAREELYGRIVELGKRWDFVPGITDEKRLLYVPWESELIQKLACAYERVTGEKAAEITKGGASYARVLDQGIAFGASFEGEDTHPHMPDECMAASSLQKAMEIYCEAIVGLCQELPH